LWTPEGSCCIEVPSAKSVDAIKWNPDGNSLILIDKEREKFCCCYILSDM